MQKLWSTIATFNVLFILNLWVMDRTNRSLISVFNPAQNWSAVPIFGLSIGSLSTILSGILMLKIIQIRDNYDGLEKLPSLWIEKFENEKFLRQWKVTVLFITVAFPLLAQIHFWRRFNEWSAWTHHENSEGVIVSLYQYVPINYLLKWDSFRYGNYTKMAIDGWEGVSFVPFWQPVIMATLTLVCFLLSVKVVISTFYKKKVNEV